MFLCQSVRQSRRMSSRTVFILMTLVIRRWRWPGSKLSTKRKTKVGLRSLSLVMVRTRGHLRTRSSLLQVSWSHPPTMRLNSLFEQVCGNMQSCSFRSQHPSSRGSLAPAEKDEESGVWSGPHLISPDENIPRAEMGMDQQTMASLRKRNTWRSR